MSKTWNEQLKNILSTPGAIAVLATVNGDGSPHAEVLESPRLTDSGTLEFLELLESARSYRNLTAGLWFNTSVSVLVASSDGSRFQLTGIPDRIIICGSYFEERYQQIRDERGDIDLAAVCSIKIAGVVDESFAVKFAQQESERPFYKHLDRLAQK